MKLISFLFQVQEHSSNVLRRHRQRTRAGLQTQQGSCRWAGVPHKVSAWTILLQVWSFHAPLVPSGSQSLNAFHIPAILWDPFPRISDLLIRGEIKIVIMQRRWSVRCFVAPRHEALKWKQLFFCFVFPFRFAATCHASLHLYEFLLAALQFSIVSDLGWMISQAAVSHWGVSAVVWWFPRIARFSNVQHLSIHISKNFGAESTRVYYIGLRGEYSEVSWSYSFFSPSFLFRHLEYCRNYWSKTGSIKTLSRVYLRF